MAAFERLDGLPPYGPSPERFSATGAGNHREGFVVQFKRIDGAEWVGNFQRGLCGYDALFQHPNGEFVVVIAGGQGYIVDPQQALVVKNFGGAIIDARPVDKRDLLVFNHQGIAFEAIGKSGKRWHTRRLSWDGFRNVKFGERFIEGEGWAPDGEDNWEKFSVDLETGASTGGAYDGPE